MDRKSRFWAALSLLGSRQARTTPHHKKSPAETGLRAELEGIGGTPKRARKQYTSPALWQENAPLRSGAKEGQSARVFRSAPYGQPAKAAPVPVFYRLSDLFTVRRCFLSLGLSISAPIFLETLGACPLVCGDGARRESVAASGTVAMGGLFGAVLSTPVGALIVSC